MNIQANTLTLNVQSTPVTSNTSLSVSSSQTSVGTNNSSDTVIISAQGLALLASSQSAAQEALAAAMDEAGKDENSTLAAVPAAGAEDTASIDSEGTTATSNLSSYTDTQLQSMVAEGSITQAEAHAELAKRESSSSNKMSVIHSSITESIDIQI